MTTPPAGHAPMAHRPEIDGLRGIAVLGVVLFHAGFDAFSGGYVGVDVFFVISGYLITRIILDENAKGSFSLARFYARRARRILPALFVVCTACIPLAWWLLTPDRWEEFARSLVATSLFSSNFFFWAHSDYFSEAAELKPLLHTWSLAVEEQFYLLFPLVFLATRRMPAGSAWRIQAAAFGASLAIAAWQVAEGRPAGFFLLPARWWEIALGVLLAMGHGRLREGASAGKDQWLALAGLMMIVVPVLTYSHDTPFPGLHALPPTLGTALLILCAQPGTLAGRLLATRPLVLVGLSSFSLYLWHQPVFAFVRNSRLGPPEGLAAAGWVLVSLLLGYLCWRFVETPFRRGALRPNRVVAVAGLGATLGLASAGLLLATQANWSAFDDYQARILRLGEENRRLVRTEAFDRFGCFLDQRQDPGDLHRHGCARPTGGRRLVIFGDSEAAHLVAGARMDDWTGGREVQQWTAASCRAIDFDGNSRRCREFVDAYFARVHPTLRDGDLLLVASNWPRTLDSLGEAGFRDALDQLMRRLEPSPARVIIVGATPDFRGDPILALLHAEEPLGPGRQAYLPAEDHRPANRLIRQLALANGLGYVDPTRGLCLPDAPLSCLFADGEEFLFFDQGHLTAAGSRRVFRAFAEQTGH